MKKGIIAFFHALVYPLIYYGSQVIATFAALIAYFATSIARNGLPEDDLTVGLQRLQSGVLNEYSQPILIAACVITILVVLIIVKAGKRKFRDVFIIKRLSVPKIITLLVLGVSMNIATVYILTLLPIPETVISQYEELVGNTIVSDNVWLTLLTTAIFVPITEEVVFRGMSFNILRKGMPLAAAVIMQSLIFAGAHLVPLQIAYVLPTAFALGLVYVWCGSFLAPVLLHISYNGFSAALSAVPVAEEAVESTSFQYADYIIMAVSIVAVIICLCVLYVTRERAAGAGMEADGAEGSVC